MPLGPILVDGGRHGECEWPCAVERRHVEPRLEPYVGHGVLVANAPYHYRGVVFVASQCQAGPVLQVVEECRVFQVAFAEAERNLAHHVHADGVAKLQQSRGRRIVGCAQEVHIGILHHLQVALHLLVGDAAPVDGRKVVVCGPVKLHRAAVDAVNASVPGYFAYPDLAVVGLHRLPVELQPQAHGVQIGRLGRPQVRLRHTGCSPVAGRGGGG